MVQVRHTEQASPRIVLPYLAPRIPAELIPLRNIFTFPLIIFWAKPINPKIEQKR